jgi:hypothetical protein
MIDDRDKTAEKLDAVYIQTLFVQIAASLAALVGLAGGLKPAPPAGDCGSGSEL